MDHVQLVPLSSILKYFMGTVLQNSEDERTFHPGSPRNSNPKTQSSSMKSPLVLAFAALCALATVVQSAAIVTDADSTATLDKRILEQCKNQTGVCVTPPACKGKGFDGKERRIDGLCDRHRDDFICCINF
ncbi:hypothetical protein EC991_003879 [Linnemannia zychae]|nr:hypothetical protein EC991_003879 [Linnemannia zychae]